ncbi:MAG TPA: hypothetical protein VH092_14590 [Urbifossiella sp.]|nr:hypothetical protein [Urbifossiella sp.]
MRRSRAVVVGVGVVLLSFLLALPLSFGVVWACGQLLPGWAGSAVAACCLMCLAGRLLPPYLRWGHRLAGVPFVIGPVTPEQPA